MYSTMTGRSHAVPRGVFEVCREHHVVLIRIRSRLGDEFGSEL